MSLLQLAATQPREVANGFGDPIVSDPLLGFAGSITGSHALILAPHGPKHSDNAAGQNQAPELSSGPLRSAKALDLLCSLLRHGCAAATCLRLGERSEHEAYDLVFAPGIVSAALAGRIICQAKRALVPTGRFLALAPTPKHQDLGALLVRSLRLAGFVAVHTKQAGQALLERADLPMHGASAMPSSTRVYS